MKKQSKREPSHIEYPSHIGIILDGNGRWAKRRGLPRTQGHRQGAKVMGEIAKYCRTLGIPHLTIYAFSTENWKRPQEEVDTLMDIFRSYLKDVYQHKEEKANLHFIGDKAALAPDIREMMEEIEGAQKKDPEITIHLAINYGGRAEILSSVKKLAARVAAGELLPEEITEETIAAGLDTAGIPEPDFIIRPSGEQRLSNFLLWQSAYAELIFMDVLWPDFTPDHLDKALAEYAKRDRRFGGVDS